MNLNAQFEKYFKKERDYPSSDKVFFKNVKIFTVEVLLVHYVGVELEVI